MSEQNFDLLQLAAPFDPKEIDWRVGQAGERDGRQWAKVLAYIDARSVMDRLDEVVGPGNWKDRYWRDGTGEGAGVMCGLAIWVNGEWVEKVDGSDETDIEAFKGGISKALVRAAVKWGVGRYLYNLGESWATIVDPKTPGARWQPGKDGPKAYKAFYWLPPALPEWAIPKKQPAKTAQVAAQPSGMAQRTAQAQAEIKDRITNGQTEKPKASLPAAREAGAGQAAAAQRGAEESIEAGTDRFFREAGVESPSGAGPAAGGASRGQKAAAPGAGASAGREAEQRGVHAKNARAGAGRGPAQPGAAGNAPAARGRNPAAASASAPEGGTGRDQRPVAGAAKSAAAAVDGPGAGLPVAKGVEKAAGGGSAVRAGEHAVAGGEIPEPGRPHVADGGVRDGQGSGLRGPVSPGAGKSAEVGAGEAPGAQAKPVPKTAEEIAWFTEYMKSSLREVKNMAQLSELWTTNVNSVRAMPKELRDEIVREKDDAKARIQK